MNLTKKLITTNYTKGRNSKISEITLHHTAGNILLPNLYTWFNKSTTKASSHYGVKDNEAYQFVDEGNTAWCNGNSAANNRAVTIECSNNCSGEPWTVSDASLQTCIELIYDIAKRNGLLPLTREKFTMHCDYKATNCPGAYLKGEWEYIMQQVNTMSGTVTEEVADVNTDNLYRVRKIWSDSKTQIGAYASKENAVRACQLANPYSVFDSEGKQIYPE